MAQPQPGDADLSYAALGYFQYLFFYWVQYYFERFALLVRKKAALYMTFLTLAMGLGMLAGGWATDFTRRHFAHRRVMALVPAPG